MLSELKLFQMIQAEMDLVTTPQLEAAARKLDPAGETEKMIGLVESEDLRRLFVAAKRFLRQAAHAKADTEAALTDEEAAQLREQWCKFHNLEKFTLDLFWMGLKAELHNWQEATESTIGIREDWRVVVSAHDHSRTTLGALLQRLTGQE